MLTIIKTYNENAKKKKRKRKSKYFMATKVTNLI